MYNFSSYLVAKKFISPKHVTLGNNNRKQSTKINQTIFIGGM